MPLNPYYIFPLNHNLAEIDDRLKAKRATCIIEKGVFKTNNSP